MIFLYRKHKKAQAKKQREAALAAEAEAGQFNTSTVVEGSYTREKVDGETETVERPVLLIKALPPAEIEEDPAVKRQRRVYRWTLILCLFPSAFLAAIDTTIVATSLTTIASHFGTFKLKYYEAFF